MFKCHHELPSAILPKGLEIGQDDSAVYKARRKMLTVSCPGKALMLGIPSLKRIKWKSNRSANDAVYLC